MKLLFFKERGIFAALIRWWTRSPYAHVELEFSDGQRLRVVNGQKVFVGRSSYKPDAVAHLAYEPAQESRAFGAAVAMIGASYDWKGIVFSQVLPLDKQDWNKWFCSEACAYCLQKAGLLADDDIAAVWSPGELATRFNALPVGA
jgi:hypothetical protein